MQENSFVVLGGLKFSVKSISRLYGFLFTTPRDWLKKKTRDTFSTN